MRCDIDVSCFSRHFLGVPFILYKKDDVQATIVKPLEQSRLLCYNVAVKFPDTGAGAGHWHSPRTGSLWIWKLDF